MKILEPEFVEFMPPVLLDGVLYVSMTYGTAVHKCPCGCGEKVVTPLNPTGWKLTFNGKVTLSPSVANGSLPCKSHYFIRNNVVCWAKSWDDEDFDAARKYDQKQTEKYFKRKKK